MEVTQKISTNFLTISNMISSEPTPFTLPGLTVTSMSKREPDSKFDLTVYLRKDGNHLDAKVVYNATLFRTERIESLVAQYQQLLEQIVTSPDQSIQHYSLMTPESQAISPDPHQPLDTFTFDSVPTLIRAWAMHTPDHVAVQHGSMALRYDDLLFRSEACARALRQQGLGQGDVIAIRGARSIGLITAMVGGWLAGGVVMPLDPKLPDSRQTLMRRNSRATFFIEIGTQPTQDFITEDRPTSYFVIEPSTGVITSWPPVPDEEQGALPSFLEKGPAYVFFTSGTTGVPKGILGSHQALAHFLAWQQKQFSISAQDRVAHFTSVSFDAMLRDLFLPLTSGATVCLPPEEAPGIEQFAWMAAEKITVVHLVPSIAKFWLALEFPPIPLPALRWVFFAGEPLTAQLLERWETACPSPAQFVNLYGPTETTLVKSWYQIPANREKGIQPIGRPLPQTQIFVLGDDSRLCGIGEVGELVIRTPFRSLGYLMPSDDIHSRFRPNPYRDDPSDILYYTGYLGRYRLDGTIDILGRRDDQVKIRGVRVEPQEVAAVLQTCPEVQGCTVLGHPDLKGEMALTAYVVTHPDTSLSGTDLRTFLSARIPHALVPSQYVLLEHIPLNPNGKIDRQALQRLTPTTMPQVTYVAPRTPNEEALTHIWETVLGHKQIGTHDNFFELGGHSLLATQILSRIRETIAVTLPLRTLFEAQTVAELAACLQDLQNSSATHALPPIRPLPPGGKIPISFAQERMWFLYQFAPSSAAYNLAWAFQFPGLINLTALERAVNEIRRRHAVLRSVFPTEDGYPSPLIHPFESVSIPVVDFQDTPESTREAAVQRFATTESQRPFDIAQGPLMRPIFIKVKADQVVVLIILHHIVADGWSWGILRRELETLYDAFAAGRPSPLDELPIQYHDFAAWQREWLQGNVLETQLRFWKERLAGAPMTLDLPHDRPRGALQTFVGRRHTIEFSRALTVGLTQLIQREGVTLFMTLLASLSIQLGRYTASDDLLVGVPIANRHFLAIENLIGTFVNTLVCRTQLGGNPSFVELLRQVRQTTLEAYAHQDLPFEVLVDAIRPPRDLSRSPVFQVMLSVLNFQQARTAFGGKANKITVDRQAAQFDLTLAVGEHPDHRHSITWIYNSDVFEQSTIERMAAHFEHLLEEIVATPARRIHDLTLLPKAERQQMVVDWNATTRSRPCPEPCLPELLEARAGQQPDSIAVMCEGQAVTYGVLNQRANQLAHYLQSRGVGPEVRVAIYCERSLELLVTLWGIVKAGGAYVPIDPTYPSERVAFMLEDAAVAVIVAQQHGQASIPPQSAKLVWIDTDWPRIAQEPTTPPPLHLTPDNLAYMIYTSGSTGTPKGVQVPHRALVNFLEDLDREPGLHASDRLLAVTSLSFDIAGLELWLPVLVGGQVVLASREMVIDGAQLLSGLETHDITVMQATPATWQLLVAQGWKGLPGLRLLCGGEQMPLALARQLGERSQGVWNLYGPTETTVWSTRCALPRDVERMSIGRPIANTQTYVEDRWGHLAPIGVPGELFISGEGVTRGYWGRPDITAERFVPHPDSLVPGARRYRTGDEVRYRADGQLEWLARLDHQIKLRGYRIELGEIETALRRHPSVQQVVSLCREDVPGDKHVVAYLVPTTGHSADVVLLRTHLSTVLPDYMVPSRFVVLDSLPLTANGKIDRKALPAPNEADRTQGRIYAPPTTELEELLVELWQEVLNVERIGIHENFFELGGHSLLATRMIARMRNTLELAIPLRTLFEYPTVAGFAKEIDDLLPDDFQDPPPDGTT
ncbi:MAG: amino acid adenylation domain-containing protein [Nitrospirales bacterium]